MIEKKSKLKVFCKVSYIDIFLGPARDKIYPFLNFEENFWFCIKWNLAFTFIVQTFLFLVPLGISKLRDFIQRKLSLSKEDGFINENEKSKSLLGP